MDIKQISRKISGLIKESKLTDIQKSKAFHHLCNELSLGSTSKNTTLEKVIELAGKYGIPKISQDNYEAYHTYEQVHTPIILLEVLFKDEYYKGNKIITAKEQAFYYNYLLKKNNTSNKKIGTEFLLGKDSKHSETAKRVNQLIKNLKQAKNSDKKKEIEKELKKLMKNKTVKFYQKYEYKTGRSLNEHKIGFMNNKFQELGILEIKKGFSLGGKKQLNELVFVEKCFFTVFSRIDGTYTSWHDKVFGKEIPDLFNPIDFTKWEECLGHTKFRSKEELIIKYGIK